MIQLERPWCKPGSLFCPDLLHLSSVSMKRNDNTRCDPTLPGDDYQPGQGLLATCDRDAKIASRNLSKQGLRIARTRVGKGIFATKPFHRQQLIGEIQGSLVCNSLGGSYYAFDWRTASSSNPTLLSVSSIIRVNQTAALTFSTIGWMGNMPKPNGGSSSSRLASSTWVPNSPSIINGITIKPSPVAAKPQLADNGS